MTLSAHVEPAISFRDLTLGYDRHPAVHHIDVEVVRGELLAIVGPNGAGKSTLLKGIMGELKPLGGSLKLDGLKKRDIAYLPQQIEIDRSFPISVFDCVAMGLWRKIGAWRGLDERGKRGVAADARANFSLHSSPVSFERQRHALWGTSEPEQPDTPPYPHAQSWLPPAPRDSIDASPPIAADARWWRGTTSTVDGERDPLEALTCLPQIVLEGWT